MSHLPGGTATARRTLSVSTTVTRSLTDSVFHMIRATFSLSTILIAASAFDLAGQQFGGSLAVGSGQILIGETGNGTLPGIVYVYQKRSGVWSETAQLMVGEEVGPPDGFGQSLAADGNTLLVGAPVEADGAGAAYLFRADNRGNWSRLARLTAGDRATDYRFGTAVALRGNRALVSAPGRGAGAGVVYVFELGADGNWSESGTLVARDAQPDLGFGALIALESTTALVATAGRRDADASVYAFHLDQASGRWTAQGKLEASGLEERSGYGRAIGLGDGLAVIGAPGAAQRVGAALVFAFDTDAGAWTARTRLAPFEAQPNAQFGASVSFDGTNVLVGAPGDADGRGALYTLRRDGSVWAESRRQVSASVPEGAGFASGVMVAGDIGVAAASGVDSRAGAAVILERGAGNEWRDLTMVRNEVRGLPAITGGEVECTDHHAATFQCNSVNILSFLPIKDIGGGRGTRVNDVWGWTDPETNREYAIVGRTDGTSFIDISDPGHPVYVANLPKTEGSRSSIWRDMKVYRDHVYIVADAANEHGVQVFDLRQLRALRTPPVTVQPTTTYHGIHSAHNIVINEATGFAYTVGNSSGGETCGGGLHMIDLTTPSEPKFAGCFADPSTGRRKTGYSHDAQCVIYHGPDVEHSGREICLGSNETALSIADVTDKAHPVALAAVSYPNVAYTHQGWLTEDHRYFYLNDEGDEPQGLVPGTRTLVWDVADLDDPVLVKEYIASTTTTDHNLYVRGNTMYQSNYGSGLRILDVSDPTNPVEIGFLDTTPYGNGGGSWSNYPYFPSGVIVATSIGDGVFVLKSTARPVLIP